MVQTNYNNEGSHESLDFSFQVMVKANEIQKKNATKETFILLVQTTENKL